METNLHRDVKPTVEIEIIGGRWRVTWWKASGALEWRNWPEGAGADALCWLNEIAEAIQ
jgi:hypothetical protein